MFPWNHASHSKKLGGACSKCWQLYFHCLISAVVMELSLLLHRFLFSFWCPTLESFSHDGFFLISARWSDTQLHSSTVSSLISGIFFLESLIILKKRSPPGMSCDGLLCHLTKNCFHRSFAKHAIFKKPETSPHASIKPFLQYMSLATDVFPFSVHGKVNGKTSIAIGHFCLGGGAHLQNERCHSMQNSL